MINLIKHYKYWILFIAMLLLPMVINSYTQYIVNLVLIYVMVVLGFNIVLGYVGRFSFANATFYGIGAYSTGLLMVKLNMPFFKI